MAVIRLKGCVCLALGLSPIVACGGENSSHGGETAQAGSAGFAGSRGSPSAGTAGAKQGLLTGGGATMGGRSAATAGGGAGAEAGAGAGSGGLISTAGAGAVATSSGGGTATGCGDGAAQDSQGKCVACSIICNREGQTGDLYPRTTQSGLCVCESSPGYFYTVQGGIGTYPCDADGDGWVRDSARFSMESQDPTILANALCKLRKANQILLENEAGESYALYPNSAGAELSITKVDGALPLYESDRNDEQLLLTGNANVPTYGNGSRSLVAAELNSLTKACVSAIADHNDNGISDVEEWAQLPTKQIVVNPQGAGRDPYLAIYTRLSYFTELHRAWFEPVTTDEGGKATIGRYHIRERSRAATSSDALGITNNPAVQDPYWRSCRRKRDAYFDAAANGAATYDFASISGATDSSWGGMLLHSQFKCVELIIPSDYNALNEQRRRAQFYKQTSQSIRDAGWEANRCKLAGSLDPGSADPASPLGAADVVNPRAPLVTCEYMSTDPVLNQVVWVATNYQPYSNAGGYLRGCVNECVEGKSGCVACEPGPYGQAKLSKTDGSCEICGERKTDDALGVFVSPTGVEAADCGSRAKPCQKIATGIAKAVGGKTIVYVAPGSYTETITLRAGLRVEGAWKVDGENWTPKCDSTDPKLSDSAAVAIQAPNSTNVTVMANDLGGAASLAYLTVESKSIASPAESLYGVFARGATTNLTLNHVNINTADGGNGVDGTGGGYGANATVGGCSAAGDGLSGAAAGEAGKDAPPGAYERTGYAPSNGTDASGGLDGHNGTAPTAKATCANCCAQCDSGCSCTGAYQTCGSDGKIGCGGKAGGGGKGGAGGGSSIPLYVWDAAVTAVGGILHAGKGGHGGRGGVGGRGGSGTSGVPGGQGATCSACSLTTVGFDNYGNPITSCGSVAGTGSAGSSGGPGGNGTDGGLGGAGAGGSSFAVYIGGVAQVVLQANTLVPGEAGGAVSLADPGSSKATGGK